MPLNPHQMQPTVCGGPYMQSPQKKQGPPAAARTSTMSRGSYPSHSRLHASESTPNAANGVWGALHAESSEKTGHTSCRENEHDEPRFLPFAQQAPCL